MPWKDTKGHHWIPEHTHDTPLDHAAFDKFTTPMSGTEHQQVHKDSKDYSNIGAIARYERRILEQFDL